MGRDVTTIHCIIAAPLPQQGARHLAVAGGMHGESYTCATETMTPYLPGVQHPAFKLFSPTTEEEIATVRGLFSECAQSLAVDLALQGLDQELARLPGDYAPPRGCLYLAEVNGSIAGCCALRPLDNCDYPNAAEMKRLYVRRAFRGFGLGRVLAEAILDAAQRRGYSCILLDTLNDMEAARALYEELGFTEIPPYYHSPYAGAPYLKVELG